MLILGNLFSNNPTILYTIGDEKKEKKNKNTSNINSKNHTNHSKSANKNLYSKKFNREQNKTLNTIQKIIDDEPL